MRNPENSNNIINAAKIMREIGGKIRDLRLSNKLTQTQLGLAIGVSYQQIHKYEVGVSDLPITRLIQICIVLNSEIEQILGPLQSKKRLKSTSEFNRPL